MEDFLLDEKLHIPDDASKIIQKLIGDKHLFYWMNFSLTKTALLL
ncbi:hypothetical protein [Robertmurraya kyonggiensis]|nr:hypothetical protein [Robertmurraya kyonggiensis]